jgi:hypothetical protein
METASKTASMKAGTPKTTAGGNARRRERDSCRGNERNKSFSEHESLRPFKSA